MSYQDNAHGARRNLAPARDPGAVPLPIDTPPIVSRLPRSALVGLSWEFDAGTIETPIPRPFTQYQSTVFPNSHPSSVGPAAIRPRYGYSQNDYSPIGHRLGGVIMEGRPAVPVTRTVYAGRGRGSLGRSSGRVRGAVTPFPPANPAWRDMFSNALVDGNG